MDSDASVTSAILSAALRCNTIRLTLSISSSLPRNTCCLDKPQPSALNHQHYVEKKMSLHDMTECATLKAT